DQVLTNNVLTFLATALRGTCLEVGDLKKRTQQDICLVKETSVPSCSEIALKNNAFGDIKSDKLSGTWFAVYQLKGLLTLNS
ncbi:hypothetical protein LSH36_22g08004, partial [Paralvinella palmiformis]